MRIRHVLSMAIGIGVLALALPACSRKEAKFSCPIAPKSRAYSKANDVYGSGTVLPNGRLITPAGTQVTVVQFPLALALSPDGQFLAVGGGGYGTQADCSPNDGGTGCAGLSIVTLSSLAVTTIPLKDHFVGLAFSPGAGPGGWRLIVSGGLADHNVNFFTVTAAGTPVTDTPIPTSFQPAGLALSRDGRTLYVAEYSTGKVAAYDLVSSTLSKEITVGSSPYGCALSPDDGTLYVSNWGSHSVSVISTATKAVIATITVGKNPEAVAFTPDGMRAYVANADSDTITVIDARAGTRITDIPVGPAAGSPKGVTPNALAVSPDGTRLYSASAGDNAVEVISTGSNTVIGRIPTGWYPTAVLTAADGKNIFVANAKGEGTGPNVPGSPLPYSWTYILELMKGTVSVIAAPDPAALASLTQNVKDNNEGALDYYDADCPPLTSPVPTSLGQASVIKHIVFIVRENKTYDCLLGDLGRGNGDPSLALFGKKVTPNLHSLADRFVSLDNFYDDSEVSSQGHMWTAANNSTDFTEKVTPAEYRDGIGPLIANAFDEVNTPEAGVMFSHLKRFGISYMNYGEFVGDKAALAGQDPNASKEYFKTILSGISNFDVFETPDVVKADIVIADLNKGLFPSFVYIWLPNDHTYGTEPGKLTPQSMVADNDEATGRIIDAISHSPYWPTTAVFVVEDDTQDGADHVDAHRSICLIASPWIKRGYISSVHYSIPSLYKTFSLILGIPPISRYDELAPAMYDCFAESPDLAPYVHIPRMIPVQYNLSIAPMAGESSRLNFSQVDEAGGMLGKILWTYVRAVRDQW